MVACAVRPSRRLSKTSTGSAAKRRHLQLCHARFIELSCTSPDVNGNAAAVCPNIYCYCVYCRLQLRLLTRQKILPSPAVIAAAAVVFVVVAAVQS